MAVQLTTRAQYAYAAGFRNTSTLEALSIIVAISQAECGVGSATGCETGFCCGGAAGIWQIQLDAHPWATLSCAENPSCCAGYAFRISGGTSFSAWTTYNNGAFRQYLTAARNAIAQAGIGAAPPPPPTPPPPTTPPPESPTTTTTPGSSSFLPLALLFSGTGIALYAHHRHHQKHNPSPTSTSTQKPSHIFGVR